jgi:quinolinate synthase
VAKERPVKWVVFCGVHFMAETADMLTPETVEVILPDLSAGCSMADMAQYDDTVDAWERLHESLREQGWKGRIIPITYVNSTAAIKAFVGANGGACCTSSNADKVFAWAMAGGTTGMAPGEDIKILFLPDQHLGRNTAAKYGIDVVAHSAVYDPRRTRKGEPLGGMSPEELLAARAILWAGHCSVHKLFRPGALRPDPGAEQGGERQGAVHDHGAPRVLQGGRGQGGPGGLDGVHHQDDPRGQAGLALGGGDGAPPGEAAGERGREEGVEVRILSDCQCLCTTMFRIDQPHLLWVLDHLAGEFSKDKKSPKVVNAIKVHPEVRRDAVLALDRMLSLTAAPAMVD